MPEKSKRLSVRESELVGKWLEEHWVKPRSCPISGHDEWEILDRLMYLYPALPGELLWSRQLTVYPLITVVCKGCGHSIFFSAKAIGIAPPPGTEPGDGGENG